MTFKFLWVIIEEWLCVSWYCGTSSFVEDALNKVAWGGFALGALLETFLPPYMAAGNEGCFEFQMRDHSILDHHSSGFAHHSFLSKCDRE